MGTRKYYEDMQSSGHLRHDLTGKPGLGAARCPRCNALINPHLGEGPWTMGSEILSAIGVVGSITFGVLSGVNGYNTVIPYLQNRMKGPKLLPFVIGLPLYSGVSATCAGYVLPKFAQLTSTTYYTSLSSSNYWISLLSRRIEKAIRSRNKKENE